MRLTQTRENLLESLQSTLGAIEMCIRDRYFDDDENFHAPVAGYDYARALAVKLF